MEIFSLFHQANIITHITAGSSALLIGLFILFTSKGGKLHQKTGRIFLLFLSIVIFTGLLGVFIFKRNSFLLVITILTGYLGFSGVRAVRNKANIPKMLDLGAAALAVLSITFFLYYFKSMGMIWSPVIIYSTVGYLMITVCYDLCRYLLDKRTYNGLWMYEHIVKMISTFSGLLSAFVGTILPQYHPYSQFLPSVFGTLLAIGFVVCYKREKRNLL